MESPWPKIVFFDTKCAVGIFNYFRPWESLQQMHNILTCQDAVAYDLLSSKSQQVRVVEFD